MKLVYVALVAASILLSADKKKSTDNYPNSKNVEAIGSNEQHGRIKRAVEHKAAEANEELLHEAVLFNRFQLMQ